jgi:hypothetical protein
MSSFSPTKMNVFAVTNVKLYDGGFDDPYNKMF